jgi:hypothetical protein
MKRPRTNFGLNLLITFGILLASMGVILHFAMPEKYDSIELIPIAVGFTFAYFGALWKDPERAKQAGEAVTHAGAEIAETSRVWRGGNRPHDPVVDVTKRTPIDDPNAEPTVEVSVKQVGDLAPGALTQPGGAPPAIDPTRAIPPVPDAPGASVPGEGG